ncbi:formylglycine-generating enzyme family protein [Accumulibacter sp.]|jgi:sulfatase modifying factor 1|uniref:Sulfatase-modifying factor enzyme-like domain-containing protein n=1 Tax=Accumulibacter regalis TaxID=522306 RepID=C7RUW4_ACCRE|nr:formylglycine-generating enzyme family protein [Accumulibacter sp.]MBN8497889.1 formylglycine-generating enzyme family protein [Accumulibacter sp.]MBO3716324.1 formylglycine-generating enzyme family protein [Accumulibacter sp.]
MNAVLDAETWRRRGPAAFPPPWASAWGGDRFGLWADLAVAGVVQRLRWIEPGSFLMGDETQPESQVLTTIDAGFWLADTACTQALWLAVMGENPSYFSEANERQRGSPQHPVECVSWNDVVLPPDGFLARLRPFTAGVAPELPTDAEWEYACRAGTRTAYSFGDRITSEQVNCFGRFGEGMTVAVRSLPANLWGLYEMHGNVWEWCAHAIDREWRSTQGDGSVAARTLRGGSWLYDPMGAGSAFRRGFASDGSLQHDGFRFALRSTGPAAAR